MEGSNVDGQLKTWTYGYHLKGLGRVYIFLCSVEESLLGIQ